MKRKSIVLAILAALASSLMVAGVAQPAVALTDVNTSVEWVLPSEKVGVTDSAENVHQTKCATVDDSDTVRTVLSDGTIRAAVNTDTASTACSNGIVVGHGGQVFTVEQAQVSAYDQNGARLWTTQVGSECADAAYGGSVAPHDVLLGKDGNLYILSGESWDWPGCPSVATQLIRVSASDGSLSVLATLSGLIDDGTTRFKNLQPYKDGVMLFEYSFSGSSYAKFFGYSDGQEIVAKRITIASSDLDGWSGHPVVSYEGDVTYTTYKDSGDGACGYVYSLMYVSKSGRYSLVRKDCEQQDVHVNTAFGPDGSIHLYSRHVSNSHMLYTVYRPSGVMVYTRDVTNDATVPGSVMPPVPGESLNSTPSSKIDTKGNVLWLYDINASGKKVFILKLVNPSGSVIATLDSRNLPDGAVNHYAQGRPSLVDGALYMGVCTSACTATSPAYLHKINMQGLGMDFPRGAMLDGFVPPVSQKLKYVAMGDSFSSGEGNSDFDPWTDRDGLNMCHRSQSHAYPRLLANDDNLNLDLVDFVACSGATTHNVLNGQWNELAQVGALSSETKVVTMTIGGNDMGFMEVLNTCSYSPVHTSGYGCSNNATLQNAINDRFAALSGTGAASIDGHPVHSLESIYRAIHATSSSAAIYVGGYPHLFGSDKANFTETNDASVPGGAFCTVLPGVSFSYDDTQWINTSADDLNNIIKAAVDKVKEDGVNIHYVPPAFGGRSLCDSDQAWLYGVLPGSDVGDVLPGSMHPDVDGQFFGYGITFSSAVNLG